MTSAVDTPPRPYALDALVASAVALAARSFGIAEAAVYGPARSPTISLARHLAMYLCFERGRHSIIRPSYLELAERFRRRDHTTVRFAIVKVQRLRAEDPRVDVLVSELLGALAAADKTAPPLSPEATAHHGPTKESEGRPGPTTASIPARATGRP